MPPFPEFGPPLLNSACLWASTHDELEGLYTCPHSGAVTTRTACHPTEGFQENESQHQHTFKSLSQGDPSTSAATISDVYSLNTYGYSPYGLAEYITMIENIQEEHPEIRKTVIFSVTGDSETVAKCWKLLAARRNAATSWCMEINLSCPNIAHRPPPAYSKQELDRFLSELRDYISEWAVRQAQTLEPGSNKADWESVFSGCSIPIGIKLPPYTYAGQFDDVAEVITKFNSEGFGSVSNDSKLDKTASEAHISTSEMVANSIDPTLLSTTDADNYMTDVSIDMFGRLSLGEVLEARRAPALEPPSLSTDLADLMKNPLGKYLQQEKGIFSDPWPISFVTSTNTLGSSLLMERDSPNGTDWEPALGSADGSGIGGLAGALLHPLALGNVVNLRRRLQGSGDRKVHIIGVGGVSDIDGFHRMRCAGADKVAIATALGARGLAVFEEIAKQARILSTSASIDMR